MSTPEDTNALDYYTNLVAEREQEWAEKDRAQIAQALEWRGCIAEAFPDDARGLSEALPKALALISSITGTGARGQLSFHEICAIKDAAGLAAKSCPNKILGGMALALQAAVRPFEFKALEKQKNARADHEGIIRQLSLLTVREALKEYPLKALTDHNRSSILQVEDIARESGLAVTDKKMTRLAEQANRAYARSGAEGPVITISTFGGEKFYGLLPKKLVFTY